MGCCGAGAANGRGTGGMACVGCATAVQRWLPRAKMPCAAALTDQPTTLPSFMTFEWIM